MFEQGNNKCFSFCLFVTTTRLVAARTAAIAYASQEPMRFLVKRAHASYTIAIPLVMLSCIQHANLVKTLLFDTAYYS